MSPEYNTWCHCFEFFSEKKKTTKKNKKKTTKKQKNK